VRCLRGAGRAGASIRTRGFVRMDVLEAAAPPMTQPLKMGRSGLFPTPDSETQGQPRFSSRAKRSNPGTRKTTYCTWRMRGGFGKDKRAARSKELSLVPAQRGMVNRSRKPDCRSAGTGPEKNSAR
jgi:hypothetical protein